MFIQFGRIGEVREKRTVGRIRIQIQQLDGVRIQPASGKLIQAAAGEREGGGGSWTSAEGIANIAGRSGPETRHRIDHPGRNRPRGSGIQNRPGGHRSAQLVRQRPRLPGNQV